jgi:uncharacterized protein (DUF1810 family)
MDTFNLERFLDAQGSSYGQVCEELRAGHKRSHWIWFIFPQMRGLGHSETAQFFGISSRQEASAYLEHPVLGARLRECTGLVLELACSSAAGARGELREKLALARGFWENVANNMPLWGQVESGDLMPVLKCWMELN